MAQKGNPYDNARAESFIKTLKYEDNAFLGYGHIYKKDARIA